MEGPRTDAFLLCSVVSTALQFHSKMDAPWWQSLFAATESKF